MLVDFGIIVCAYILTQGIKHVLDEKTYGIGLAQIVIALVGAFMIIKGGFNLLSRIS